MRVGNLVRYTEKFWHPSEVNPRIGLILEINTRWPKETCPIHVRWVGHTASERDWYARDELKVLHG